MINEFLDPGRQGSLRGSSFLFVGPSAPNETVSYAFNITCYVYQHLLSRSMRRWPIFLPCLLAGWRRQKFPGFRLMAFLPIRTARIARSCSRTRRPFILTVCGNSNLISSTLPSLPPLILNHRREISRFIPELNVVSNRFWKYPPVVIGRPTRCLMFESASQCPSCG